MESRTELRELSRIRHEAVRDRALAVETEISDRAHPSKPRIGADRLHGVTPLLESFRRQIGSWLVQPTQKLIQLEQNPGCLLEPTPERLFERNISLDVGRQARIKGIRGLHDRSSCCD